jgi:ribose transport system permease protein
MKVKLKNLKNFSVIQERGLAPVVVLAVLFAILYAISPQSITPKSMSAMLDQAAVLLLLAAGQCLIILMGRVDLANAAMCSAFTVITAVCLNKWGMKSLVLTILIAVIVGTVQAGLHSFFQVPSFVITLGFFGIAGGVGLVISKASTVLVQDKMRFTKPLFFSESPLPIAFMVSLVIVGLVGVAIVKTPWGRALRAVGLNQRATTYSGINTFLVVTSGFILANLFILLGAYGNVGQLGTASARIADSYLLPGIAAVVVGGTSIAGGIGGLGRTIWGVIIIALLRIGLDIIHVPQNVQPVVYGLVIIVAITITVDRKRVAVVA